MAAGFSETGAQLFARLGAKPSLEALDPLLFPPSRALHPGDAVELYGPSGCGKTELLLHLISNCILPETWRGAELGGLGVGVILVDADFQFSMLRLFQVLERRIVDEVDRTKERSERLKEHLAKRKDASNPSLSTNSKTENVQSGSDTCEMCKKLNGRMNANGAAGQQATSKEPRFCDDHRTSKQTGKKRTRTGEIILCNGDECNNSRTNEQLDSSIVKEDETLFEEPTADQIEAFIRTCLNRFYLVRAGASSDQLIITLHSLESLIANRPDVSVLMLENVAAFYWIDRMNGGVASAQEANQRRVVGVIKRLIGEYQLVLVATKPALIQRNRRNNFWNEDPTTPTTRSNTSHSDYEHHEFMCSAWNKLITHRFVMRRHEHVVHAKNLVTTQSYYTALRTLPTPDHLCRFAISNKGVVYQ
ncbi:DNA repair protein XRCC2-like [Patiria miniata]|uniref:RecA family profile 1 domain-containing protein n=1 Tax=Patiria miniata TaxID=46514 RepID=A0A913Z2H3_PATMI|nr:DNA repair protein XRCC2-like [Patiria miniata]